MKTTIKISDFQLFKIGEEYADNFKCVAGTLSDFHANALCILGRALMPAGSVDGVFCDNVFWYDDKSGDRWGVFQTVNGIALLKNFSKNELYRILFL